MELLPFTDLELTKTINVFKKLTSIVPKQDTLKTVCQSFDWSIQSADEIVLEFATPCQSPFLVDLYQQNLVAGGFIALCFLDWDKLDNGDAESEQKLFDSKYFEIVTLCKELLGEPDLMITETEKFQKSTIWRRENAFILVLQGADDYEGIDIRLWLEYFDGSDVIPNSQIFEWLSQRHLSKIERSNN